MFKSKKTETQEVTTDKAIKKLIISTRLTEKASLQSEKNAYTFIVSPAATKIALREEILKEYKVTPREINITNLPKRNVFVRGKFGVKSGIKKAIIFLKPGDKIELK